MPFAEQVAARVADLTPAELRTAEVVLAQPQTVAFGTVAQLAEEAATSGATVIRLAVKLGYDGFAGLQDAVQRELTAQLRPAVERIRHATAEDTLTQVTHQEVENLQATLLAADRPSFEEAIDLLSDIQRSVTVCPGDGSRGIGYLLGDQLLALRDRVNVADGGAVRLGRELSPLGAGDVLVLLDVRRYDKTIVDAAVLGRSRSASIISLTDSRLGPVARMSDCAFVVHAGAIGPFDSQIGTLALVNALIAAVAHRLRAQAAPRLDRTEQAWQQMGALTE